MGGGGGDNNGVKSLVPHLGPMASIGSVLGFLGYVWLIVKHPRIALNCTLVGVGLAVLGYGDATGVQDSVPLFLIVIVVGGLLADGKSHWRKQPERVQAPAPARRPLVEPGELTMQRLSAYVTAQANTLERKAR